jgi:hypothetical protein
MLYPIFFRQTGLKDFFFCTRDISQQIFPFSRQQILPAKLVAVVKDASLVPEAMAKSRTRLIRRRIFGVKLTLKYQRTWNPSIKKTLKSLITK